MPKSLQILPPGTGPAAGLGLQLAVGMAFFVGGGIWLDRKRGGGVLFTLLGIGLGLFYSMYECWKVVRGSLDRDAVSKQKNAKQEDNTNHR
ncbi:MAG: AtpZ/AtpI family protein [Kiritimatiellae bacterium]|nr:AtpZ/AtpI family protein [Kiritimatiellia bacterium]